MSKYVGTGRAYVLSLNGTEPQESEERFVSVEWKKVPQLNINDAALLSLGFDPQIMRRMKLTTIDFDPRRIALISAVRKQLVEGELFALDDRSRFHPIDADGNSVYNHEYDLERSYVDVASLIRWLESSELHDPYFNRDPISSDDFLDRASKRYAWKAAAAYLAWHHVPNDQTLKGTTKQKIEQWLWANGDKFYPQDKSLPMPKTAIEEIAQMVNWDVRGGAPEKQKVSNPNN